jgi:TetR/AcrR family transcriptional repressor of nem operon
MNNAEAKRERIVKSAETLFHRQGYTVTSLADIAGAAKVPLGNVYYYFKTKEDLVATVVEGRNAYVRGRHQALEKAPTPLARLEAFLQRIHDEAENRAAHGCPVGGLAQEAGKLGGRIAQEAGSTFGIMLDWVGAQYQALGFKPAEARERAVDLVAAVQGSILLGHSTGDAGLIRSAMKRLQAGLRLLAKKEGRHA